MIPGWLATDVVFVVEGLIMSCGYYHRAKPPWSIWSRDNESWLKYETYTSNVLYLFVRIELWRTSTLENSCLCRKMLCLHDRYWNSLCLDQSKLGIVYNVYMIIEVAQRGYVVRYHKKLLKIKSLPFKIKLTSR